MTLGQPILSGPAPKHEQVRERIIALVVPGQAIPSERELMAAWGVSRATIRKAIDRLVGDGLLQRTHGLGTFAVRPRVETRLHLASFSQDMRRRGFVPSTRTLEVSWSAPGEQTAAALGLDAGEPAWRVVRIRLADGVPMAHEDGWYNARYLPGLDQRDLSGSLYQVMAEEFGQRIDAAEQVLWGEAAPLPMASLLAAPQHTPLLVFRRTSWAQGRPIEHVVSRYRGDRYQIHMSLSGDMLTS